MTAHLVQHNDGVFLGIFDTFFQTIQQNIILTIFTKTIRLAVAHFGISVFYPITYIFTAVIIIIPKNIITGGFDYIQQILSI